MEIDELILYKIPFPPQGIIADIEHTHNSGGITIVLENGIRLYGDNGMTVRALDDTFGGVIDHDSHTFDPGAVIGKTIAYDASGGILESIGSPEY